MKFSNFLIKYGLIVTLACLVFLLILQPLNYREYKQSEEKTEIFKQNVKQFNFKINYAEVNIKKSNDNYIKIAYFEEKGSTLKQAYVDNTLTVSLKNPFKIGANTMYPVTIYLPESKDLDFDFTLSVGNINVEAINLRELVLDQGIGYFGISNSNIDNGKLFQSIGKMQLTNIKSNNLLVDSDIGHVVMKDITSENASLKKSIGKANLKELYAQQIKAKVFVGSIDYLNKDIYNYQDVSIDVPIGHNKNNIKGDN